MPGSAGRCRASRRRKGDGPHFLARAQAWRPPPPPPSGRRKQNALANLGARENGCLFRPLQSLFLLPTVSYSSLGGSALSRDGLCTRSRARRSWTPTNSARTTSGSARSASRSSQGIPRSLPSPCRACSPTLALSTAECTRGGLCTRSRARDSARSTSRSAQGATVLSLAC